MAAGKGGKLMKKLIALLALATLAITAIALPVFTEFPLKLVYNASPSAPYGFYRIDHASGLKRGVFTVVPTPPVFRWLAAKNHYLPFNVPLIKRVVAMSGDEICRIKQTIFINQKRVATALIRDSQHRRCAPAFLKPAPASFTKRALMTTRRCRKRVWPVLFREAAR